MKPTLRRHSAAPQRDHPDVEVEALPSRVTGDARTVAGGTVSGRARAGGHALVIGRATVCDDATVVDHAVIAGRARVCGTATVSGHAAILDDAWIGGSAWIFERAVVGDQASVGGHAQVFGTAILQGQATVTDQAWVFADARIQGHAHVGGRARIGGGLVTGTARIDGDIRLRPGALVGDHAHLQQPDHVVMLELARRVHATLYRCHGGLVGAGLPDGWHGPLDLDDLPEELLRHHPLIDGLADRWALKDAAQRLRVAESSDCAVATLDAGFCDESGASSDPWAGWTPPTSLG